MPGTLTRPVLKNRELLPPGGKRRERTLAQIAAAGDAFDYPATQVGVVGNITLYYDPSLGAPGLALANQMLNFLIDPYVDMEAFFGVNGAPFSIVIAPLSGNNDGSGGAYHYGCDFNSGGVLYLDATFNSKTVSPWALEVGLYVAELSECFMGTQNKGWGCGYSNGEALSRFCAERETPAGTLDAFATGPAWDQAGRPDWISKTEQTDRDGISTGCGMIYLYWMLSQGFTVPQITQAGGATLAANYQTLTGKTTAYNDMLAALSGLTITSDNPFPAHTAKWNTDDLTAETGAPNAASNPGGYMFVAQGTQHVVYRDVNGHIQEEWWDNNGWHNDDVTAQTNAPLAASDPVGYVFDAQGTQHVMYRDVNGHIQELWWNGTWNNDDLTAQTNAPLAAGDPTAYMFDAQSTQHVMYRDVNGHIQELWWNGTWNNDDVTAQTNAPLAAGDPAGYLFDVQGTQHVMYRDVNGHIQELWWGGNWNNDDVTAQTNAPLAASDPTGYVFDAQGTQHVMYRDVNGHIQELWWGNGWNNGDLTAQTNAPLAAGDPSGYMFDTQATQHVMYRDVNGHVQELWWGNGWNNDDLTAQTNAPSAAGDPKGYMFPAQGTQHVVYRATDNHIHELWWG